jgi:hypothetical protein
MATSGMVRRVAALERRAETTAEASRPAYLVVKDDAELEALPALTWPVKVYVGFRGFRGPDEWPSAEAAEWQRTD